MYMQLKGSNCKYNYIGSTKKFRLLTGKKTPDVATPSTASTAGTSQLGSTTDSNTSTSPSVSVTDREVPELLPSTADAALILETDESSANDIDTTEKEVDDLKEAREPYIKDGDSESPQRQLGKHYTDEPASTPEESGAPVGFVRGMAQKFSGAAKSVVSKVKGYLYASELQEVVTKKVTIDLPYGGRPKTYCRLIQYTPMPTNALVLNSSSRLRISLSIKPSGAACYTEDTHLFVRFAGYNYSMKDQK